MSEAEISNPKGDLFLDHPVLSKLGQLFIGTLMNNCPSFLTLPQLNKRQNREDPTRHFQSRR